jgi:nucleoside-diphosphate-sugar epimerase
MGKIVAGALGPKHDVKLTDLPSAKRGASVPDPGSPGEARRRARGAAQTVAANDLDHDAATDRLVAGMNAVVHIGYGGQRGDATALLDYYSRRTYNLLLAAANAKVERCVFVSTLRLLEDYEENLTVTERWRSHPPSGDPALLACHIGELVCKEFARDRLVKVATLRLGWPVVEGSRTKAARSGETAALATDDLALALNAALTADIEQWQDIHVQSPVPDQRYLMQASQKLLGFPEPLKEARR